MPRQFGFTLSIGLIAVLNLDSAAYAQIGDHAHTVLTQTIDESAVVTLRGNTRPEATVSNDRGRVRDDFRMEHMFLQLRRPPEQQRGLEQFLDELLDPKSPAFHKWLTAQQFGERFGIAEEDIGGITTWLKSHGFTINATYPNLVIDFSGTAGQIREAFRTEIHHLSVNDKHHYGNMRDPRIPAALDPIVIGIASLHDFVPRPLSHAIPSYTISSTTQPLVPADLATIYNFNLPFAAGYSGQGQTIVLLEHSNLYSAGDWLVFRKVFGLARDFPQGGLVTVHPQPAMGNNCVDPGVNSDGAEAILDAEWASAAAPNATIEIASCADTSNFGGFIALQNLLTNGGPPPAIVSIGFGESEILLGEAGNAFISSLYQLAVAQGVSVFVSSGDSGAAFGDSPVAATHGIAVNGLASTPHNVSVGGTDFADTYFGTTANYWSATNSPTYGSAQSYIPEIPWNDSCASELLAMSNGFSTSYEIGGYCNSGGLQSTTAASGGPSGCVVGSPISFGVVGNTCAGYAKPFWQSIAGNPNDGVRDIPDVSLFAANGRWGHFYVACYSDLNQGGKLCLGPPNTWVGFGGTSLSAPVMAGIQALVNQETGSRWGNPNPVYYKLASMQYGASGNSACNSTGSLLDSACAFYDITLGDIDVNCFGPNNCFFGANPGFFGALSTSNVLYQPAYRATAGWDFATGIGTVNVWNLMTNWSSAVTNTSQRFDLSAGMAH
jgi:subtilase family serine protease